MNLKDFSKCTLEDLMKVQELLNTRPRKVLKYITPKEALNTHIYKAPPFGFSKGLWSFGGLVEKLP